MAPDDEVCYCYHVSLRKLVAFAQRERPRVPSQMSECFGAGSGCGWCIPFLCRIHESVASGDEARIEMTPEEYAAARAAYRAEKRARNQFTSSDADLGSSPSEPRNPRSLPVPETPDRPGGEMGRNS